MPKCYTQLPAKSISLLRHMYDLKRFMHFLAENVSTIYTQQTLQTPSVKCRDCDQYQWDTIQSAHVRSLPCLTIYAANTLHAFRTPPDTAVGSLTCCDLRLDPKAWQPQRESHDRNKINMTHASICQGRLGRRLLSNGHMKQSMAESAVGNDEKASSFCF